MSDDIDTNAPVHPTSTLARLILSLPFLIIVSMGGCVLGSQLAIESQLRDGGRHVIPPGMPVNVYFPVAVYNKATNEISISSASVNEAPDLFTAVASNNDLTFLLPAAEGQYGSGEIHDITGRYRATTLDKNTQRIELRWDEMDDMSGITTYKAKADRIVPERYGLVGPGLMMAGVLVAAGLLMIFFTLGNHLNYLAQPERTGTLSHYALCVLIGGIGLLMIMMAVV